MKVEGKENIYERMFMWPESVISAETFNIPTYIVQDLTFEVEDKCGKQMWVKRI